MKRREFLAVTGMTAAMAVTACLVMIPMFGLTGAAYAILLVCITEFLINLALLIAALIQAIRTDD